MFNLCKWKIWWLRRSPAVSRQTHALAAFIAMAIRSSADEETAIRRICGVLRLYDCIIYPSSLGCEAFDSDGSPIPLAGPPSPP